MTQRVFQGGADAFRRLNRVSLYVLGLVARVRPDERRDVLGAFLTLFGFMVGHAILETARDSLFLANLSARRLPWVYLAIAVVALVIGQREPRVVRRLSGRSELSRWLLGAAVVTSSFWLLAGLRSTWVFYALYVWSGVLASLVVVRFWTLLASRFTVTQAKRIFPVIASGSVAGAIFGSAVARGMTEFMGPRHLVLAAGAFFLATAAAPSVLAVEDVSPRRRGQWADIGQVARTIWSGPYLKRVAALVLLATVTFTLVDFVFKSAADRLVAAEDLGQFFSTVYLSVNLLSLLVQVGLVAWLLRHIGLVKVAALVPAVLLSSTLGFAVAGGLALALVLKGTDGTLRHSLHRTATELLFVPLSDRLRTDVKSFIDVVGQRGGQALGSIVILMLLSTTADERVFAALACLTATGWLVVAIGLREPYLDLFRETLQRESAPRESSYPAVDVASLEALLATLNMADDRRVIAALDVLGSQGKERVVPALLLYHPSPAVVIRALELFATAGREDALPMIPRLMQHGDPAVRAAGLRAYVVLAPTRQVLHDALADPDPGVAASGRAGLVACGWADDPELETSLIDGVRSGDAVLQGAVASMIRARPSAVLEALLRELLASEHIDVLHDAVAAASALRSPSLIDPLMGLLARRAVRDEARRALAVFGPLALERLERALDDRACPLAVRRHVPLTIATVGSVKAPEILLRHLRREPDGMIRFKVLRALGRWRREQPGFPLDLALLRDALGYAVSTAFRLMGWRRALSGAMAREPALQTELHELLVALLRDKQDHALERAFRLLALQSSSDEYLRLYRGLFSPQPQSRAGSRELLHHMVLPPLRTPLITLIDDLHGEERVEDRVWDNAESPREIYAAVLGEIVGCGMESASALAAVHAAELGMGAVAEEIRSTEPLSEEHAGTLERAASDLSLTREAV